MSELNITIIMRNCVRNLNSQLYVNKECPHCMVRLKEFSLQKNKLLLLQRV